MKPVLFVKNSTSEGPGLLEIFLDEKNIEYEIVDLDNGEQFPDPLPYAAIVVLGGPDSANDITEKMQTELEKVKEIFALGIPYFGICLGLQVGVKAAGGKVVKSPVKEVGFRDEKGEIFDITLTAAGRKDKLLEDVEGSFSVFHLHGETVLLTENMQLLGEGKLCKNQLVKIADKAYGIQAHLELTPEMFREWCLFDPDLRQLDQEQLTSDFEEEQGKEERILRILFQNFLKIAGYA